MGRSGGRVLTGLLVVLVLAIGATAAGYYGLRQVFQSPGPSQGIARIQVEQGASVRTVLNGLARLGALRHPRAVELYLRLSGRISGHQLRIQAGMYEIPAGASPAQILELFDQG
jgi:cell division protein YceG involved in septum cleavage